ncbi:GNAT family N-acetyltransferase [Nocardia cyriacigeorgica]|uniref:GNAT family N-acetyltransferase n=1 Tax=Nocardia cyriacigeorgica TaxID=135487 RepID=UPI00189582B3|nr:GNAT family N-acetyltransferase [Nocardia cyriacigeorgica]MBF6439078.1 hypothetical protein [Nocardia cyriacigeorgica]
MDARPYRETDRAELRELFGRAGAGSPTESLWGHADSEHINVAPEGRGTGAADAMMRLWFTRLRSVDSPGCHLQTLVQNARAVKFFDRMGFRPHGPRPLVPGVRYQGKRVRQQTMVREF